MAAGQAEFASELKALGINVSRETLQRLETYAALLTKWQAKINLVGPATLPDLWRRHFLDSAQLVPLLPANPLPQTAGGLGRGKQEHSPDGPSLASPAPARLQDGGGGVLVDLGSGAGFPGLVLAIMTDWRVHLVDSDQRKCAFLRQVALDCGVLDRVTIHPKRIEQVTGIAADVVTARACAPLDELLELAAPLVGENGTCLFLKGAQVDEELTRAERHWTMRLDRRGSISDPAGNILIVTHLQRKIQ
ncbi:MAG TPA: 16S rRNA (guanine(527)-N(7))-methyltransferase RsmG [Dongiaceae bacterium]|jgi:16S rRNA (guanine527-N7)-methyltransferase|nr:16S rRNA (guanine(527)-N(7))-methyltransferase RsmG [Dongiaceae bacterium]